MFKILNFRVLQSESKVKSFFDVGLDNGIIMKGFKIAQGPTGLFVGMPSEKDKDGKWWDRVFIPRELKDELTQLALQEYEKASSGGGAAAPRKEEPAGDLPF
jgi:DNA-binding cell septation regulator SpoVG